MNVFLPALTQSDRAGRVICIYNNVYYGMGFEWDEDKNQSNITKHTIDFRDAKNVFEKPMVVRLDERKDYGENRLIGENG